MCKLLRRAGSNKIVDKEFVCLYFNLLGIIFYVFAD